MRDESYAVYWLEEATGHLRDEILSRRDLLPGRTLMGEVALTLARRMVKGSYFEVPVSRMNEAFAVERVAALQARGRDMAAKIKPQSA